MNFYETDYPELNLNINNVEYEIHGNTMEERRMYLTNIDDLSIAIVYGGGPGTIDELEHLHKREQKLKEIIYYPRQGGACAPKSERSKIFKNCGDYDIPDYLINSVFNSTSSTWENISEYFISIFTIFIKTYKNKYYTPLIFWLTKHPGIFIPVQQNSNNF